MAAATGAAGEVKLILDEMHSPAIATALAEEGWDVTAVAVPGGLRGVSDEDLLAYATREDRWVVTENVVDFAVLAARWASEGRAYAGLIFTNPKRFNRANLAYPGNLLAALRTFLEGPPELGRSSTWWLQ